MAAAGRIGRQSAVEGRGEDTGGRGIIKKKTYVPGAWNAPQERHEARSVGQGRRACLGSGRATPSRSTAAAGRLGRLVPLVGGDHDTGVRAGTVFQAYVGGGCNAAKGGQEGGSVG